VTLRHLASAGSKDGKARAGLSRRSFLGGAAAGLLAAPAFAQDADLQRLIDQTQRGPGAQGFDSASRNVRMPRASTPTLSPATAQHTEMAIQHYGSVASAGGWPNVPAGATYRLGMRHPGIVALRQRLVAGADLDQAGTSVRNDIFDSFVEAGVRRFQLRHGLTVDGIVREQTLAAMNVPVQVRLRQLETNVVRLRAMANAFGPRTVVLNIPAAQIEAIENGTVVSRHTAVVGKADRPSPLINSRIIEINFNPFWTVPVSIVRRDLIPKMQAEPDYLQNNKIRIYDGQGNELQPSQINWYSEEAVNYRFRQDPGDHNSLGTIRINFPNQHQVYMHDTPFKNLFGDDFRFHSSGCSRVQNVRELVAWLLQNTPGWSRPDIDAVIRSGERKDARLRDPVPLHWVYVTAWATPDGVVQFRDDIYDRDGLGAFANRG
jgi:murein L,D-transpeptidase YcbB/YkuD